MVNKTENTEETASETTDSVSTNHRRADVDVGLISVSLAVSAGAGFIASQNISFAVRACAALGFILSTAAAFELYWAYLTSKVPHLTADAYGKGEVRGFLWLVGQWVKLLSRGLRHAELMSPNEYMELGLLNLAVSLLVLVGIIAAWIALSMLS
jgi:hypothetical protein